MSKKEEKTCKACGRTFLARHGNEKYCNRRECKDRMRNPYRKKEFKCPHCGEKFKLEELY